MSLLHAWYQYVIFFTPYPYVVIIALYTPYLYIQSDTPLNVFLCIYVGGRGLVQIFQVIDACTGVWIRF